MGKRPGWKGGSRRPGGKLRGISASGGSTAEERALWRLAWGLPDTVPYEGWSDPRPLPPDQPCRKCEVSTRWWIEAEMPHRYWRCCSCQPAPDNLRIRHWTLNDPVDAAERDAIADAAPERHAVPASGKGKWLNELGLNNDEEDEWK